ncbi:histidine triad nucleotide-binding protein 3 isoform X2 [Drosophila eugracilis]|uniref:histidine triad nucleotide-binding protein 3 isoform X2 n=1 Tax=Drosophila eugracilis TaxID=29029 RepID=UPI0007E71D07|nr:histidine triad nucleotide-binding protein 3 isoform X2 [Drosophila eugracilis]
MPNLSENIMKRKRMYIAGLAGLGLIILVSIYNSRNGEGRQSEIRKCFFCDFAHHVQGPPPVLEVETDEYVIFKDKYPASTFHYLAIPKEHFDSFKSLNKSHLGLVQRMDAGMKEFLKSKNINPDKAIIGFHMPPFISVHHLHMHGIYPPSEMSFGNKINFFSSFWFKTSKDAISDLKDREL